jgi:hypothetical protein
LYEEGFVKTEVVLFSVFPQNTLSMKSVTSRNHPVPMEEKYLPC